MNTCPDFAEIEQAISDVFEPGYQHVRRAIGHPAAPVTTEPMVMVIRARLTAGQRADGI